MIGLVPAGLPVPDGPPPPRAAVIGWKIER